MLVSRISSARKRESHAILRAVNNMDISIIPLKCFDHKMVVVRFLLCAVPLVQIVFLIKFQFLRISIHKSGTNREVWSKRLFFSSSGFSEPSEPRVSLETIRNYSFAHFPPVFWISCVSELRNLAMHLSLHLLRPKFNVKRHFRFIALVLVLSTLNIKRSYPGKSRVIRNTIRLFAEHFISLCSL